MTSSKFVIVLLPMALASNACKTRDWLYCESNADCTHFAGKTYCDVNGEYPESDDIKKTCIASPFDAKPSVDANELPDGPPDMALLRLTPDTWPFPAIDRGATGSTETFIVENRGGLASGPIAASLTGTDMDSFTILTGDAADCGTNVVKANSSCFVRVQFTPTGAG